MERWRPVIRPLTLLGVGLACTTVAAARAVGDPACERNAESVEEIVTCMKADLAREDQRLRTTETRLRSAMDAEARATFDSSAAAWRAYRDVECRAVYASYAGGNERRAGLMGCRVTLTQVRRRGLADLYPLNR